jgi:DNA-3-methyladenine glycosylase I
MTYCEHCAKQPEDDFNKIYHDNKYGFPINSDAELFGRLILEINQAGLSWITILKKEANFRLAFDDFNIEKIANYQTDKIEELLQNTGIIRNKLKINAVIYNAQQVLMIIDEYGSFQSWLNRHDSKNLQEWVLLFKKYFKFVGGEIVNEFLMSVGYLKGAHENTCSIYQNVLKTQPNWLKYESNT